MSETSGARPKPGKSGARAGASVSSWRRYMRESATPACRSTRSAIVGEQRPDELVERRLVAARDGRRRQRANRRGAGHVHRERDFAEVVAGTEDRLRAASLLRDGEHAA